jgi:hypothetical protein
MHLLPPDKAYHMSPASQDFAMKLAKAVRESKCERTFTVDEVPLYLMNGEPHTVLRSDEASITSLFSGMKPHQALDVLDELVELGMLSRRQPNRYSITSKLFEAIS